MLDWFFEIPKTNPVAHAIGMVAIVCALGMALGSIKLKKIGLGSSGVLFAGILAAHYSEPVNPRTLAFVRDFGLILFVFAMGLQLGPGFFASLQREGLRLNILAALLVLLTAVLTPCAGWLTGVAADSVAGLFAGASTNTPALGAAQQALAGLPNISVDRLALPALACAVSYPAAVVGSLLTLLALKLLFRIDPEREAADYAAERLRANEPIERRTLVIENASLDGQTVELACESLPGIVVSRVRPVGAAEVRPALPGTCIHVGDAVLAVGSKKLLDQFQRHVGRASDEDLMSAPGQLTFRRIVVTDRHALGKLIAELGLESKFGVEATRLARGEVEMTAAGGLRLQFGDVLQVVGSDEQLNKAAIYLGNSLKKLNETQFIPFFAGIFLGVLVGSVPIALPGLSHPVRLGLAGGPLIVALFVGRLGHLGGLVWHMPQSANHAVRELGISLFFAALGLLAGDQFFAAVVSPQGLTWLALGLVLMVVPLLLVGIWARLWLKLNFVTLGGLLSGGTTNPPALAFVSNLCRSDAPALAYATVYPLTTVLRILAAQVLAIAFSS